MADAKNKILERMLERLFAGLLTGPNLNCRPHSSRQRVDFAQLEKLQDIMAEEALGKLLGDEKEVKFSARVPLPKKLKKKGPDKKDDPPLPNPDEKTDELTPEEKSALEAWSSQQNLLGKLCILADEARTYEQDTGVHVLNVGFPLLSMPPGSIGISAASATKRVLAPIAFIPVNLTVRTGPNPTFTIACRGEGIDRVSPNTALLAWLEQRAGAPPQDLFADEEGKDPWREVVELVRHVAKILEMKTPEPFEGSALVVDRLKLRAAPRSEEAEGAPAIIPAAVLGLFPMNNQGILRDMQAMVAGESLDGPVESFIRADVSLDQPADVSYEHEVWSGQRRARVFSEERLVSMSDPCQSRAVRLARECRGLVIHGPPGTGKSQTITNVIGDHLARGERVLIVCDKRTALDVVANRLEHLGLGSLAALVHDPRHDQRDLYRAIREQLDNLTDAGAVGSDRLAGLTNQPANTREQAEAGLKRIDAELQKIHGDLTEFCTQVSKKDGPLGLSLHELIGQWLDADAAGVTRIDPKLLAGITLADFQAQEHGLHHILERAAVVQPHDNPWMKSAGVSLEQFLARPLADWRQALESCIEGARKTDGTVHPTIAPFAAQPTLQEQGEARARLATQLRRFLQTIDASVRARWAKQELPALRRARKKITEVEPSLQVLRQGALDPELAIVLSSDKPAIGTLTQQLGALEAYLQVADRWYGVLFLQRRARAFQICAKYGLPPDAESCRRLRNFIAGLRARLVLQKLHFDLIEAKADQELLLDELLEQSLTDHAALLDLFLGMRNDPIVSDLAEPIGKLLGEEQPSLEVVEGLERSTARAASLVRLEECLKSTGLFDATWAAAFIRSMSGQGRAGDLLARLRDRFDSLEGVLRIRLEMAGLPAALQRGMQQPFEHPVSAETAGAALRRAVLEVEIGARLAGAPALQAFDRQRLAGNFNRYRTLEQEKRGLVRDLVLQSWVGRQQQRLLVGTGSRLNGQGADLRRRLTMRGERALRLRQVIAVGQAIEGGDPLFDLRPLWLASPQTVGQIFPRLPLFDVVVFDEASQCRLEEALPVLTRAKRVVIAGDPKQLPPTRFFESAITVSEDEEIESEQQLFEAHQGEVEDLLSAALSIDIQQCYLDVHYRSRNADLIEFSNQQFYSSRLQAIPGHPSNRVRFAPITLYRADGVYDKRRNVIEAEQVCKIVRDLLKRATPPSIGIACFNLTQRDLIVEKLDELAGQEREFADKLSSARGRRGSASFEGLFVKNLENVQGDERDHIIISTTYGPDPQGRFYRRFGPLGRAGGGRRLNVLVTRAREEVHLVTSIPPEVYRNLPEVPTGQTAGGGWLLFAYLAHAEHLARIYEEEHQLLAESETRRDTTVQVRPSRAPSLFAQALARRLVRAHQTGSDVHWGNDGFCVDLALHHPTQAEDVTLGILCDGARFAQAEDPVEWDIFRSAVLEGQGWRLHRLWTPHFFRDAAGSLQAIMKEVKEALDQQKDKDAIRVPR